MIVTTEKVENLPIYPVLNVMLVLIRKWQQVYFGKWYNKTFIHIIGVVFSFVIYAASFYSTLSCRRTALYACVCPSMLLHNGIFVYAGTRIEEAMASGDLKHDQSRRCQLDFKISDTWVRLDGLIAKCIVNI